MTTGYSYIKQGWGGARSVSPGARSGGPVRGVPHDHPLVLTPGVAAHVSSRTGPRRPSALPVCGCASGGAAHGTVPGGRTALGPHRPGHPGHGCRVPGVVGALSGQHRMGRVGGGPNVGRPRRAGTSDLRHCRGPFSIQSTRSQGGREPYEANDDGALRRWRAGARWAAWRDAAGLAGSEPSTRGRQLDGATPDQAPSGNPKGRPGGSARRA